MGVRSIGSAWLVCGLLAGISTALAAQARGSVPARATVVEMDTTQWTAMQHLAAADTLWRPAPNATTALYRVVAFSSEPMGPEKRRERGLRVEVEYVSN
ncbi:MAG TPA: hypothetical protein VMG41_01690 [Gemmatimonadales bacterium]|nr:hypothetical protein [Gemmatimonadales bacterium]